MGGEGRRTCSIGRPHYQPMRFWSGDRIAARRVVLAAHMDHVRYGLSLMNRWNQGDPNPWSEAAWTASWKRSVVNEQEWAALRQALEAEARTWLEALRTPRDYSEWRHWERRPSCISPPRHSSDRPLDPRTCGSLSRCRLGLASCTDERRKQCHSSTGLTGGSPNGQHDVSRRRAA